jgi:hypothetical protein
VSDNGLNSTPGSSGGKNDLKPYWEIKYVSRNYGYGMERGNVTGERNPKQKVAGEWGYNTSRSTQEVA